MKLKILLAVALCCGLVSALPAATATLTTDTAYVSSAGATVTFTATIGGYTTASALGWEVILPSGWVYASTSSGPGVTPTAGSTGTLSWAYFTIPTSPATFTFTVTVPAGIIATQTLAATAYLRVAGVQTTLTPSAVTLSPVSDPTVDPTSAPTVATGVVSSIGTSSASASGEVTSDNGASVTARGIVFATTASPTLGTGTAIAAGSGTGSFTASLSGLSVGTTYHLRAYATNAAGTGYGSDVSFTTSVVTSPTLTASPMSSSVSSGGTATFTVAASGTGTIGYQWQISTDGGATWTNLSNGSLFSGTTTASLAVTATSAYNGALVRCAIADSTGTTYSGTAVLTVTAAKSRLINLSARGSSGSSSNPMILGFCVKAGSDTTATLPVLLRGVGPTLTGYSVSGVLADPQLYVYTLAGAAVANNDNWGSATNANAIATTAATVGAFSLSTSSLDSAVLTNFAAGLYTAHVVGAGSTTGVALVEGYDASATPHDPTGPQAINFSVRGPVGTDANVLIAGFVIAGDEAKTLLLRGVGPTLADYGVSGVLADPQLKLCDANGATLASNDNWGSASNAAAIATTTATVGAFTLVSGSADAAIIMTLAPGIYTLTLSGVNSTTGTGLIEIYAVD